MKSVKVFLNTLIDKVTHEIYEVCLYEDRINMCVEYESGYIEIYMTRQGNDDNVIVVHNNNEHCSSILEETIFKLRPVWDSIYTRARNDEKKEEEYQNYLYDIVRIW